MVNLLYDNKFDDRNRWIYLIIIIIIVIMQYCLLQHIKTIEAIIMSMWSFNILICVLVAVCFIKRETNSVFIDILFITFCVIYILWIYTFSISYNNSLLPLIVLLSLLLILALCKGSNIISILYLLCSLFLITALNIGVIFNNHILTI